MVLIHLKSQFVSLIVTVLSGAAELCLFAAALGVNRYAECNALKRGRPVSVRFHRIRTKFLAIFAMVVFIVLEVIMSFFSDPALSSEPERRLCVTVNRFDTFDGSVLNISSDSIFITCVRVDGDQVFQRIGNRSLEDADVRCSKSAMYKSVGEGRDDQAVNPNQTLSCITGIGCVFTEIRGRTFLFSALISEDQVGFVRDQAPEVPFLETILFFDLEKSQEAVLGPRALLAYGDNVNDPQELRRRILTSSDTAICPFFRTEDATEVPLALIYVIAISWLLSLLAFVSTLLFKRQIFYDMGDPLHWAQRTYRHIDEPISGNPVVTSVYEHGERLMYVSSSSSDEYDFLRKVKTSLRDRFRRDRPPAADGSVEEQRV